MVSIKALDQCFKDRKSWQALLKFLLVSTDSDKGWNKAKGINILNKNDIKRDIKLYMRTGWKDSSN